MPLPTQEFLGESMIQHSFHDEETLKKVWGRKWGVTNHVGAIQTVLPHRPGKELELLRTGTYEEQIDAMVLRDRESQIRGYTYGSESINPELVRRQHDGLRNRAFGRRCRGRRFGGDKSVSYEVNLYEGHRPRCSRGSDFDQVRIENA